jgi:hypothetical protein
LSSGTMMDGDYRIGLRARCGYAPIMSLIARRVFMIGDVVTTYGGALDYKRLTKGPSQCRSHGRRLPGSDWVLDGKAASILLSCSPPPDEQDGTTHARAVHGYEPLPDQDPTIASLAGCQRCGSTGPNKSVHSRRLLDFTGLGFMANTPTHGCRRSRTNVRSKACAVDFAIPGIPYPEYSFYVATRRIEIDDEIIAPYVTSEGNPEFAFPCLDETHHN